MEQVVHSGSFFAVYMVVVEYMDKILINTSGQRPLSVPSLAKQVEFSFFPPAQAQIQDITLPPLRKTNYFEFT